MANQTVDEAIAEVRSHDGANTSNMSEACWLRLDAARALVEEVARLRDRLRAAHGGCRMLSEGDDCDCGLCKRDREIERLRAALPDPARLRLLADWFDNEQSRGRWQGNLGLRDVQHDLRKWAGDAEAVKGGV